MTLQYVHVAVVQCWPVVGKAGLHAKQMLTQTKQIACEAVIIVFVIIPIIAIILFCLLALDAYIRLPLSIMQEKPPLQSLNSVVVVWLRLASGQLAA